MHRPLPPLFYVGVFLLIVIAAVLMLAQVMSRQHEAPQTTPRAALALQLALVQGGDAVGLRLTCIESLRPAITEDAVKKAQAIYARKNLDDLVGTIEEPEAEAQPRRLTVKTPDGLVLTRLLLVAGQWQAESLWFLPG